MVLLRERVVQLETQGQQPGEAAPDAAGAMVFCLFLLSVFFALAQRGTLISCRLCFATAAEGAGDQPGRCSSTDGSLMLTVEHLATQHFA